MVRLLPWLKKFPIFVAKEFREWLQDIKAPEEFFYATLARVDRQSAIDLDKKVFMGKLFVYLKLFHEQTNIY